MCSVLGAGLQRAVVRPVWGLQQAHTDAGRHVLRNRLRQQPQLEHTTGRVERVELFSSGAEVGQQRRVFGEEREVACHP